MNFLKVLRSPTVMTWLGLAVRFGGLAFLVPLALVRLDVHEFLVWQILSTIAAFTGMADFGLQPTFSRLIAFVRGGGSVMSIDGKDGRREAETDELSSLLTAQRAVYLFVSLVAGAGVLCAGAYFLYGPISQLRDPSTGWSSLTITAVASTLVVLNGSQAGGLTGFNRISELRLNELIFSIFQIASTAAVIALTGDLLWTVLCYSLWSLPLLGVNWRLLSRVATGAGENFSTWRRGVLPVVWATAWRSGLGILMSFGVVQFLALLMTRSEPAAQAASHLLGLRMMTAVSQVAQAPFYSKLPAMAALKGGGDNHGLDQLARRATTMAHWTYVLGAVALLVLLPVLLRWASSDVPPPDTWFMVALVAAFFFERYVGMHVQLYSLTGHIVWHKLNFAIGGTAMASYLALHPVIGSLAFPLALLLGYMVVGAPPIAFLSVRSLNVSWLRFERTVGLPPAIVLIVSCMIAWALL